MDKFCKDCRHINVTTKKPTCDSPKNVVQHVRHEQYLVTGVMPDAIPVIRGASCSALRTDRGKKVNATVCGPAGNWWEPKEV
jgi:hypothetical protein